MRRNALNYHRVIDLNIMEKISAHIKVKVYPDAAKEEIMKISENSFRVFLRESPQRGMANKRLLHILKSSIDPPPKKLRIVSGEHSQSKVVEIKY
jgi:uncharacterized protein (TIGR00251 family)